MICPRDGTELQRTERGEVEIDICPECRGVWLDRGELDKIVAHSVSGWRPESESYYREKNAHGSYIGELFDF